MGEDVCVDVGVNAVDAVAVGSTYLDIVAGACAGVGEYRGVPSC